MVSMAPDVHERRYTYSTEPKRILAHRLCNCERRKEAQSVPLPYHLRQRLNKWNLYSYYVGELQVEQEGEGRSPERREETP